ncbi:unnamed protein product [Kuraishia capsulata CBS 1993]|uniref:Uncharacterized protein n=1 Tax=Kuraishia capsulata CBS 1993 TaxID=1382522 RepID=W6MGQ6_9ASCO|nr:uncharacterized protein KUCA_T00001323001 [Kuraishia capsulata CBS 1993]CDK25354.1 unnamed protein product [Kuraishia capsulata CBS 1993]
MPIAAIPIPSLRQDPWIVDADNDEFYIALSTPSPSVPVAESFPTTTTPSLASVLSRKRRSCVKLACSPCAHSNPNGSFMSCSSSYMETSCFDDDTSVSSDSSLLSCSSSPKRKSPQLWLNVDDHPLSSDDWHLDEEAEATLSTQQPLRKRDQFVSKLSSSLKSISNFANAFTTSAERNQRIISTYQAMANDNRLPLAIQKQADEPKPIMMKTFRTEELQHSHPTQKTVAPATPTSFTRSREPRINSSFLRVYALDYSSKAIGLLNVTEDEIDLYQQCIEQKQCLQSIPDTDSLSSDDSLDSYESDDQHYLPYHIYQKRDELRLALMSREKLWSNVILPPRDDQFADSSLFKSKYACLSEVGVSNSRTRMNSSILPWINYSQSKMGSNGCLRPYGTIGDTQFVVKGWVDQRWAESA